MDGVERIEVGQVHLVGHLLEGRRAEELVQREAVRRRARASSSRPFSIASSRRSRENHWRILLRARVEATIWSQSRDGPAVGDFDVKISTVSADG